MPKNDSETRIDIPYFSGINSTVHPSLGVKAEMFHAENARAPVIGVLEKREGQTKAGVATNGDVLYTEANYGLAKFETTNAAYQGVYRVSATHDQTNTLTISVYDDVYVTDVQEVIPENILYIRVHDEVDVTEPTIFSRRDSSKVILDGTSMGASIYGLDVDERWVKLSDAGATNIIGDTCDFTNVDGSLVIVNGKDYNRMLSRDGTTITDSTEAGSLYNSPRAHKSVFYKNRIYLADYIRDGVEYRSHVIRSSYPLGIVALVDGDVTNSTSVKVTDTKYFYSDSGMNSYEVYRGSTKVTTIQVDTVNETTLTVSSNVTLLSSDEIWVTGTYSGEKQFRWISNPSTTGRDVKQYDTFKLSGGEEDSINLFDTIGNVLMIANNNAMMTWNDYTLENLDTGVGCVSPNGSVKLLGTLYFLHYSGIYATTGTTPTLVSRKIEQYIQGATKAGLESAAAGFKGMSVFFAIGDVSLYDYDGYQWKTLRDVCLECNVADKTWFIHTNVPASSLLNFINASGRERLLMAHTGEGHHVKEFLNGNTDDGEIIFFRVDTNEFPLSPIIENIAQINRISVELHRGSLLTTMVSIDGDDFYAIEGTNKKGATVLKITPRDRTMIQPVLCRKLKMSFRDSSLQRPRVMQMSVSYIPRDLSIQQE